MRQRESLTLLCAITLAFRVTDTQLAAAYLTRENVLRYFESFIAWPIMLNLFKADTRVEALLAI